jgi:hypothetical protein
MLLGLWMCWLLVEVAAVVLMMPPLALEPVVI